MSEQTIETRYTDREGWPEGPWDDEPDRVAWVDETTGLPCLVRRGGGGAWCGYVAVSPGHPWHGTDYSECLTGAHDDDIYCECSPHALTEVHGGLTYAAECEGDPREGICHVPTEGGPDDVWWLGFDCGHLGDLTPHQLASGYGDRGVYRTVGYVRAQTLALAAQVKAVTTDD